jgi:aquaporin Z
VFRSTRSWSSATSKIFRAWAAELVGTFASVSGAHFNPAVTLSALIARKIRGVDALGYVATQVLGALGAGITLRVMFDSPAWRPSNIGTPSLDVSSGRGLVVEAVLTFFLVLVVWGAAMGDRESRVGGFGLSLIALVLAGGPLTGPALNPARYLGPAAVADDLSSWWVYFVGPGIGGAVAGVLYPTLFGDGCPWARIAPAPAPAPAPAADRKGGRAPAARKR